MSADKDIVERLQSAGHFYAPPHDAILYEAAAEIERLRGEAESMEQMARMQAARADAAEREVTHLRSIASAEAKDPAPAMPNGVEAARVLADFAETAPGRLPGRVQEAIATIRAADNRDAAGVDSEEDAYVIERMGKMLAEIAVIVNGPEPDMTRWSYHDLPEKVRALKTAPAAVPAGEAVAYLDIGAGGYLDLGTEKDADELFKLPPGRHMLGIIGTYGVDGYKANPPAAEAPAPVQAAPQPADGEAGAALYGMFRALVDAGGATTVARHGAMPRPEKLMDALTRGMLAIERMFHPERFELDEFPRTAARPPAPVQAAPQEGYGEPVATEAPSKAEAHAAIATAISDGIKALRVLSTMLRKEKLQQGFMVADEILGSLGYAEKMNAALAAHHSACELGAMLAVAKEIRADAVHYSDEKLMAWAQRIETEVAFSRAGGAALQHRGDSRGGEG